MNSYKEYSEIKRLIDDFFILQKDKKYEDFIKQLVEILKV